MLIIGGRHMENTVADPGNQCHIFIVFNTFLTFHIFYIVPRLIMDKEEYILQSWNGNPLEICLAKKCVNLMYFIYETGGGPVNKPGVTLPTKFVLISFRVIQILFAHDIICN